MYLIYEKATGLVVSMIDATAAPSVLDHHATMAVDQAPADMRCVVIEGGKMVHRVPAEYLATLKAKKRKMIEAARDAKLKAGFPAECGVMQADSISRTNLTDAAMRALIDPLNFKIKWRMMDNKMVELKAGDMTKIAAAVAAFVDATYQKSFSLKAQLEKLTTVEAVKAMQIDFA